MKTDQISNPETNHGFCLMLQDESAYRRFCWYSSDAADATKRPKLVLTY